MFKEYLTSVEDMKHSSIYYNSSKRELLDPLSSGEITLSEPFRIPYYFENDKVKFKPTIYTWYSAIFKDDKLCALLQLEYTCGVVLSNNIFYLPYDITESIDNGEEVSLFCTQARVDINGNDCLDGDIYYSIDKNGNSRLVSMDRHNNFELTNDLDIKTTKDDYAVVSRYITLSKDMKKIAAAKNTFSPRTDLKDGSEITLRNRADYYYDYENWRYRFKAERKYIVNEAGEDENGEMTYTFTSVKNTDKKLTVSDSEKVYLRCATISGEPMYKICPVTNTGKALAVSDGKLKSEKWTGDIDQLWYIRITD